MKILLIIIYLKFSNLNYKAYQILNCVFKGQQSYFLHWKYFNYYMKFQDINTLLFFLNYQFPTNSLYDLLLVYLLTILF
jgi:hypothetical protein